MTTATQQLPGPARTRSGYWLGKGWDWLTQDFGVYCLLGLLALLFLAVSQGLLYGPVAALLAAAGLRRTRTPASGERPLEWSDRLSEDFTTALKYFLPALLSGLLILLFSCVGLIFLLVPGLVIFSMYLFTFHFMADEGQDFWQAMESSRSVVSRDYLGFSLFTLLLLFINLLGLLFFGVGLIITLPLSGLAVTAAYRDCMRGVPEPEPAPLAPPIVIE